jgi:RNA polymerase sigma-70 factor (ECF subfamily)
VAATVSAEPRAAARRADFALLVLPEVEVLLRVALAATAQPSDAEDLVQETLLRAWRSWETFDGAYPRAWLLTILRNAEVNRHRRRRPQLLDDPDLDLERHQQRHRHGASAEDVACERRFSAEVETALAELEAPFREAVLLVDVDGLTYAEAAQCLGVPQGTVMSRLHRGRARIRARLASSGVAPLRRL